VVVTPARIIDVPWAFVPTAGRDVRVVSLTFQPEGLGCLSWLPPRVARSRVLGLATWPPTASKDHLQLTVPFESLR
jgi:hypothetical protein